MRQISSIGFSSFTSLVHFTISSRSVQSTDCQLTNRREHSGGSIPAGGPSNCIDMKINEQLLANVRIASPCNARWEDMDGDERSRFCRHCSKHVYNFSEMTAQAAATLIREREGNLCGRFYQRADGTMLTADCPVGAERPVHWFKQLISAAAACLCLSGSS